MIPTLGYQQKFTASCRRVDSRDGNILKFGDAEYVGQLPRLIDVSMNFTPIHNFAPEYGQKFISPDPARRSSSTDDIA